MAEEHGKHAEVEMDDIDLKDEGQTGSGEFQNLTPRKAFALRDPKLSREAHDAQAGKAQEAHTQEAGQHIKSIVFGGLDGIITTFAVVAGVAGADLSADVVLVLGFANLVADGISMGFGDYLSSKAEMEYAKTEREREAWELDNYPEGEKQEMVEIYTEKGFSEADAKTVIDILSTNKQWFVDHMMVQELGIMPPDPDDSPAKAGFVTFLSFLAFGFIPLASYLFVDTDHDTEAFISSVILTCCMLFLLGLVKARLAGRPYWGSAFGVLANGSLAAAAAYLIGWGLGEATGVQVE